jgi:hypothetical protein
MTGETMSPVISAVPFILPNQLGRFPGSIGLISAITFPRRVIWIDPFLLLKFYLFFRLRE